MILATELTELKLWLVGPSNTSLAHENNNSGSETTYFVHEFPEYLDLLRVAEYRPDVFAVIAGNSSIAERFKNYPGTHAIWSVDTTLDTPKMEEIADVPDAEFLNGMAYLESDESLLLGDAGLRLVWKLDLRTKSYSAVIQDPLMKKVAPDAPDGIDGLKVYGNELFSTRGYDAILAQTQIFDDGTAVGPAKIVEVGLISTWTMDDLVVNNLGQAYVAIPLQDMIARFDGGGTEPLVVSGDINSTEIAEPTSLAFGRKHGSVIDERVLYVATRGTVADPVDGNITVGGQLVRIELRCSLVDSRANKTSIVKVNSLTEPSSKDW